MIEPVPVPASTHGDAFDPLVVVTWRDAWFAYQQAHEADHREDYLVRTAGFLIADDPADAFVHVAAEVLPDGEGYRAVTHVPRVLVVDLERFPVLLESLG